MFDILIKGLFSLFLIILIHQLFNYLKDSFTRPKIKDLVKKPTEQYQNIYDSIKNNTIKNNSIKQRNIDINNDTIHQNNNITKPSKSMEHELHNFLDTLEKKSTIQDQSKKENILEFSNNIPPPPASTTIKDFHKNNTNQNIHKNDTNFKTEDKTNPTIENVGNDITSQFSSY